MGDGRKLALYNGRNAVYEVERAVEFGKCPPNYLSLCNASLAAELLIQAVAIIVRSVLGEYNSTIIIKLQTPLVSPSQVSLPRYQQELFSSAR